LSQTEIDQFVELGYVRLTEAFPERVARQCREATYEQLGIGTAAPWPEPVMRGLVEGEPLRRAANSPRLLEAVGQLLRGEAWQRRPNLGLVVVRFPFDGDPGDTGWHVDASFEGPTTDSLVNWDVNYRSKGRGLLLLCLLSDVGVDDAPTRILQGSHRAMPSLLEQFGESGVLGQAAPLPDPRGSTALATGEAGDVYLCHPFLVHAASWPHRGPEPRFITQPPIGLEGPLRIDEAEDDLSVVARTVRNALNGRPDDR
jgi:hypothetical protein